MQRREVGFPRTQQIIRPGSQPRGNWHVNDDEVYDPKTGEVYHVGHHQVRQPWPRDVSMSSMIQQRHVPTIRRRCIQFSFFYEEQIGTAPKEIGKAVLVVALIGVALLLFHVIQYH
jgi:hypothetical protein